MPPELNPGDLLNDLFKRSDAARHCDKGVRHLEHLALSFMHVARDNEVVGAPHCMLACHKEFGNDAGYLTAMVDDRFGDRPHHADGAAAENQADVIPGKDSAEGTRAFGKSGIHTWPGAAIDANSSDFAAFFRFVHRYACALHLRHRQGETGQKPRMTAIGGKGDYGPESAYMKIE